MVSVGSGVVQYMSDSWYRWCYHTEGHYLGFCLVHELSYIISLTVIKTDIDKINKILEDSDCDINAEDSRGKTALTYAITNSFYNKNIVELLLDHGADPTHTDQV